MKRKFNKAANPFWLIFLTGLTLFQHTIESAQAQIYSGPVSTAMGGSGRAGAESSELLFLNPALVAISAGFNADLFYRDGNWSKGDHETGLALTFTENDPDNFSPGGFAIVDRKRNYLGQFWQERTYQLTLGKSLSSFFSMGVSVYRQEQKFNDGRKFTFWNGSVGTLITFLRRFGVAYVFTNPVQVDDEIPDLTKPIPQQSLGLNGYFTELIRLTFDLSRWEKQNPHHKMIYQYGAEIGFLELGLLRFGYQQDEILNRKILSGGIGFNGPRMKVNYAIASSIHESGGTMHSVDIYLPF
ncbi:MAG: hypothetical protein K1X29_04415 [Bdellovibrionales bacterium]|nr:hypothetical protein [Bdellovibrionales bacterium]